MNPFEWYEQQSNGVQLLVVVPVVVALAAVALVALTFVGSFGSAPGPGTGAPQATFTIAVDGDAVTITHAGGEAIPADELQVVVAGRGEPWTVRDDSKGSGDQVAAGDELTLSGVSAGDTVSVVWVSPDGSQQAVLARHTV